MANKYFRFQKAGHTLEQMQAHNSGDGGDGMGEEGGVCATISVGDLKRNTVYSASEADAEVVVFEGNRICNIYDGVRVYPTKIIARYSAQEFDANADDIDEMYS
jgi:hypothetical protein